jgi:ribosomal protein L23
MKVNKENFKNADLLCLDMFKRSVLTEKSVNAEIRNNCMTFFVHQDITKNHVKIAIETFYKTKVLSVRALNTKSKRKAFRGRPYYTDSLKKIMVRVESLDAIREGLNG